MCVWGIAHATGSFTPPAGTPVAESYTLDDIYTKLTTDGNATAGNHYLSTTTAPVAMFHSLTEIYNTIPTIDATKILSGTTYLGVAGTISVASGNTTAASSSAQGTSLVLTVPQGYYNGAASTTVSTSSSNFIAGNIKSGTSIFGVTGSYSGVSLANEFNGGGTDSLGNNYYGGSQANGGLDDYNDGSTAASSRYASTWTECTSANSYCGTGSSAADWKDGNTGVIWSMPCQGSGCSSFSTTSPTTYSWGTAASNNNGETAPQLCSNHSGWYLPHQKQLMQAYIDGAYQNLEATTTPSDAYWSNTAESHSNDGFYVYYWVVDLATGYTYPAVSTTYTGIQVIRCVRTS
jgi:hypothetical protein